MRLTKVLKDKKGAALEMAIIFMLVIFCFCTLLTTMTLTSRSRIKLEKVFFNLDLNEDLVTEEIIEDLISYFDMVVTTSVNNENLAFTAGYDVLNPQNNQDNAPKKKFTQYILSSRYNAVEIPPKYASYIRSVTQGNTTETFIDVVTNGTISQDLKTLTCTAYLDSIRIEVVYNIIEVNENKSITKTIKILGK